MRAWRSVRFQLAVWYLAVLALGMAVFGAGSWLVLRHVLLENRKHVLDQRLSAFELFLARESRGDDLPALAEEAREYSTGVPEGQGLRVKTTDGQVLFERKASAGGTLQRSRRVLVRGHWLDIAQVNPLSDLERMMETLAWVMLTVFPAILVIAASGGWWLAKRALQPVGAMTREARSITARDLTSRLSVPETGDELQELGQAWNELLSRIESAVCAVKRFTADAAHELRTPVTVIRTGAEIALRHPRSIEGYRQTLSSIEHETVQMTELLDHLLLLARGDAGEWKFQFETAFADQILRGLRNVVSPLAETRQTRMKWDICQESTMIWADEKAIRRLVLILVDNAIKHTPAGGLVSVRLLMRQSECVLDIADTGAGIGPQDLPYIFDRFYRADPARTPGGGSGLGLAIAHTIVKAHKGSIQVLSTGLLGTVFRVILPANIGLLGAPQESSIVESNQV
jgi:signal transduction histidine kinase